MEELVFTSCSAANIGQGSFESKYDTEAGGV